MSAVATVKNLLFGLLALQNGLINQGQLVAAFQAWSLDKARGVAEHLISRGDLDTDDRAAVEALVERHCKKHGGDADKSPALIPAGRAVCDKLGGLGDLDINASLSHFVSGSTEPDTALNPDRTASYAVGTATYDGQRFRVLRPHAHGGLGVLRGAGCRA